MTVGGAGLGSSREDAAKSRPVFCFCILVVFLFFFFATKHGLWDISSLTRDRTQALGSESAES